VIVLGLYLTKLYSIPGEEQTSYTVYLLYSLNHTIILYCTTVIVKVIIFLFCNRQRWRSDLKCLAKARIYCLVKHYDISHVVVMDECEEMVK